MTATKRLATTTALMLACCLSQAKAQQAEPAVHQFEGNGVAPFAIYLSPSVKQGAAAPLLLLLHGSSGEGPSMLARSSLKAAANKHGFIIAAPTGAMHLERGYAWNIPGVVTAGGTMPGAGDRDDVSYLLAVVDLLVKQGLADRSRVYVTGISGGGRMASWLGCVAPTRFAAIAPVVGLRAGTPLKSDTTQADPASCQPESPLPIITFAGNSDTTNPMQGGGSPYWQYSMRAAEMRWATLNHCQHTMTTQRISSTVYQESYDGCQDDAW
ncbi:alpha/beta hydrolase family esterase [Duganella flavida]|uniref:alpha/beta hydrolase family esterase n=1 Tax=Duganella flavida TaxID=2692175 RepID=UPI0019259994|nr:PHB depolymerase family esterase [Duganella flavida]